MKHITFNPLPNGRGEFSPEIYPGETVPEGIKVIHAYASTPSLLHQRRHSMASNNKFLRGNSIDADGNIIEELGSDRYIIELKRHYKQTLFLQAHDKYGNSQSHSNDIFDIQLEDSSPYELKRFLRGGQREQFKDTEEYDIAGNYLCEFALKEDYEQGWWERILCTPGVHRGMGCKVSISCNGFRLPESLLCSR